MRPHVRDNLIASAVMVGSEWVLLQECRRGKIPLHLAYLTAGLVRERKLISFEDTSPEEPFLELCGVVLETEAVDNAFLEQENRLCTELPHFEHLCG